MADRRRSNEKEVESEISTDSTGRSSSFTNTFKNILSSVLKTDLGQVLKRRVGKGSAKKIPGTSGSIGLRKKSSPTLAQPEHETLKGSNLCALTSGVQETDNLTNSAKGKKTRKSAANESVEVEESAVLEGTSTQQNGQQSTSAYKKTSKKKNKRFKGGTYHLSIKPKAKSKQKKKKMSGNGKQPNNSVCASTAQSQGTGSILDEDSSTQVSLHKSDENYYCPLELDQSPPKAEGRSTRSSPSEISAELHLEMSMSSRASASVGEDPEDSGMDAPDDEVELGKTSRRGSPSENVQVVAERRNLSPRNPSSPDPPDMVASSPRSMFQRASKNQNEEPTSELCDGTDEMPILTRIKLEPPDYNETEDSSTKNLGGKKGVDVVCTMQTRYGLKQKRSETEELESDSCSTDAAPAKKAKRAVSSQVSVPEGVTLRSNEQHKNWLQLCTCRERSPTASGDIPVQKEVYCQAIDCIDDRLIGCCNTITKPTLSRPAKKIPFVAMCDVHRYRLRAHQCCPGCGLFCSQGMFMQCRKDHQSVMHLFHERCCRVHEGSAHCPHCGCTSQWKHVRLRISAPRTPIFSQQQNVNKEPSARMSMSARGTNLLLDVPYCTPAARPFKISESGHEISCEGLPVGPDRTQLEFLLSNMPAERPMHLRYSIKTLYNAAKTGDVEKILQMLAMGFDPNHKFEELDNENALHAAAAGGHLLTVHVLQQAGAHLDGLDDNLRTPLMVAIENMQTVVIQYLIRAGVHLEARGEDGMTVLHLAAKSGNLEGCRLVLASGKVNPNIQDDGGWTPLVWSAEFRHKDIARFLLECGSDPNMRDNEQNIALHWASFSGSLEICEMFLNAGCDLTSVNEHGDTPLHIAARQDSYECVILFLTRNADISTKNNESETPIQCCTDKTSQTWMALSMNKQLKNFARQRAIRSELILHRDISLGKEANPIQCVNGVDDDPFPVDYLYVTENCETSPINVDRTITSLQSCSCSDDCSTTACTCSSLSLKCWFTKEGGLIPEFNLLDPPMIFECNRACRCWKNCANRIVQHGITCRLQLFRTSGKGWGVRALRDIPRGTFICEYIGEIISDSVADQREDDSYLFDLDNRDGETYCIDARNYGNIARFVNHLCEPNLVPVKIFVDHQDLRFPRIAFFSSRDIKAYEELGFDYGEKFWIIKYKTFTCMCNTDKCKYSADKIQEMLDNYSRHQREEAES